MYSCWVYYVYILYTFTVKQGEIKIRDDLDPKMLFETIN